MLRPLAASQEASMARTLSFMVWFLPMHTDLTIWKTRLYLMMKKKTTKMKRKRMTTAGKRTLLMPFLEDLVSVKYVGFFVFF